MVPYLEITPKVGEGNNMNEQDFRETVLTSLAKMEMCLDQNEKDHVEIKTILVKIPVMEIGLTNHLRSHDNTKRYVLYPILVAFILGIGGLFFKLVLRIF